METLFLVGYPVVWAYHQINQYVFSTCQDDWKGAIVNKFNSVKPDLGDWQSSHRRCRKDEISTFGPASVTQWREILHLRVRTQCIILLKQGRTYYLVEEMWCNPILYYYFIDHVIFSHQTSWDVLVDNCDLFILHSSLQCALYYNPMNI